MGYSNWDDDQADIDAVILHFERQGFQVYALIGHSRGKIEFFSTKCPWTTYVKEKERKNKLRNQPMMTLHRSRMIPSRPMALSVLFTWTNWIFCCVTPHFGLLTRFLPSFVFFLALVCMVQLLVLSPAGNQ